MKKTLSEPITSYKLTLKGDGITVERSISEAMAKDIITMILVGESASQTINPNPIGTASSPLSGQQSNPGLPRKSLREYLNEVSARKNSQKILAIAYYLQSYLGKATFSIADIRPQFRLANEPLPANINRDFQITLQFGWIAPDHDESKMFFVTQTGITALDNKFENA